MSQSQDSASHLLIDGISPSLYKLRHSLAHCLAQAVQEYRPGTKLGFGPPTEEGFYYDFILQGTLTEEDFPAIETIMKRLLKEKTSFVRKELPLDQAYAQLEKMGEPYKREYAQELVQKKSLHHITFFQNGTFVDMCEGPHVDSTDQIPPGCFKLRSLSGAYWRADSSKAMMTRIYVWAFENEQVLKQQIKNYEEALKRDHKKLGKDLELFLIDDDIGKGLPLWLPHGTVLRDELEQLMKELEFQAYYQRVKTPEITKVDLYYKTGHLPYYQEHIFPFMDVGREKEGKDGEGAQRGEVYCLRPMNCPHHHRIYAMKTRSYRDLPLRLAEYGQVYRYEDSGSLAGLLRVRALCINDAHIYCRPDQVAEEFRSVLDMHQRVYDILGIHSYYLRLSEWDPEDPKRKNKYVDDPAAWEKTQQILADVLKKSGVEYVVRQGEAAFYGPKIDIQFKTVTGREETASTCQLDFSVAERLGLTYVDSDNKEQHPYIIHRAPLGSHERFVAFLIEHFAGAFPTWLAPIQIKIITIHDDLLLYAHRVCQELRSLGLRAEIDESQHSFSKKIRLNSQMKIPNLLVIGQKEMQENKITLRRYQVEKQQTLDLEFFKKEILKEVKERRRESIFSLD